MCGEVLRSIHFKEKIKWSIRSRNIGPDFKLQEIPISNANRDDSILETEFSKKAFDKNQELLLKFAAFLFRKCLQISSMDWQSHLMLVRIYKKLGKSPTVCENFPVLFYCTVFLF